MWEQEEGIAPPEWPVAKVASSIFDMSIERSVVSKAIFYADSSRTWNNF